MSRIAVYIDNSNIFKNIYRLRHDLKDFRWTALYDPLWLSKVLAGKRQLEKVFFYAVPPPYWLLNEGKESKERYLITMKYYAAIARLPGVEVKYGYIKGGPRNPVEKNMDTQLSTDMVAGAALDLYDTAILVANDGDYTSAILNTKRLNKKVELLFFKNYLSASLGAVCDVSRRARPSYFKPIAM